MYKDYKGVLELQGLQRINETVLSDLSYRSFADVRRCWVALLAGLPTVFQHPRLQGD